MRRLFALFFTFCLLLTVSYASAPEDITDDVSDLLQGVFDIASKAFPVDSSGPSDGSPSDDLSLSGSDPDTVTNNNLLVVTAPNYEMSDIAVAFYDALVRAEASTIDDFSEVTDIQIMPIFTPDTGNTTIPTGTLRYVLNQIIGPYSPVVVQYQYQSTSSNYAYVREIFPDYQWMISAAIFALVLYCVFRLWGAWLCKR